MFFSFSFDVLLNTKTQFSHHAPTLHSNTHTNIIAPEMHDFSLKKSKTLCQRVLDCISCHVKVFSSTWKCSSKAELNLTDPGNVLILVAPPTPGHLSQMKHCAHFLPGPWSWLVKAFKFAASASPSDSRCLCCWMIPLDFWVYSSFLMFLRPSLGF